MRKTLGVCAVIVAAALLLSSHPARADVSMGYEARYVGLGGAGLALIDNPTQAALVNPAALSLRPTRFGIQYPNLGFRLDGTGLGSVLNTLSDLSITGGEALDIFRDFGDGTTKAQFNTAFGVAVSAVDLRARAQSHFQVTPGSLVRNFVVSGKDVGNYMLENTNVGTATSPEDLQAKVNALGADLRADIFGATGVSPSIGFGFRVPDRVTGNRNLGDLRMGVRLKSTRSYYDHWTVRPVIKGQVTTADFTNGQPNAASLASKLGVDVVKDSLADDRSGIGVDLGLLWQPAQLPYTTVALTIDNLLAPSARTPAQVTDPVTGTLLPTPLQTASERFYPRTINLGAAMQLPGGLLAAADLLDITGANSAIGKAQFRAGVEFRPAVPILNQVALRAGYNQKSGWTGGLSFGGFSLAYASSTPIVANQTFNF